MTERSTFRIEIETTERFLEGMKADDTFKNLELEVSIYRQSDKMNELTLIYDSKKIGAFEMGIFVGKIACETYTKLTVHYKYW